MVAIGGSRPPVEKIGFDFLYEVEEEKRCRWIPFEKGIRRCGQTCKLRVLLRVLRVLRVLRFFLPTMYIRYYDYLG